MALEFFLVVCSLFTIVSAYNFYETTDIIWGYEDGHAQILDGGELLSLSLDQNSGAAFKSKQEFLFGRIDIEIKLVQGNSAGTVTTFYLTSQGPSHDEIDFEFLGNLSGDPYTLHTNVFAKGVGGREMQFRLWFDPTEDFHTYSVIWNPKHVIIMVDGTPIRDFRNMESRAIPFPNRQPMAIYCSIWDAEDWATRGGEIKTDWLEAPFIASYRNFTTDACIPAYSPTNCSYDSSPNNWWDQELDSTDQQTMLWVQQNYMIYNYCTDYKRFPDGLPPECSIN